MDDTAKSRDELLAELARARARIAELEASGPVGDRLFGGLLEAAPDGIVIADPSGTIRLVNRVAERLLGYERGELVGQRIEVLVPDTLREAHQRHRSTYTRAPMTRRMGIGLRLVARRKDGSELPVEISLAPLETPEGQVTITAIRDVTERREVEGRLRRQAEALERSNDHLQQFAYVASHDLQEPLRMVSSYLQLLERRYKDKLDDDAKEFIHFAVDGAQRMQALINDLLAYSRIGTRADVVVPVDLEGTVRRVLGDLAVAVRETGAAIHVDRLPTIEADPTQMVQLFQNLIGNALKFRRPDVRPEIRVTSAREGEGWRFEVADNGIGLDPQYAERIFQIFQRLHTRQEYAGTGIGLAICKRIVERLGGTIRVVSQPGDGARFVFLIPDKRPE